MYAANSVKPVICYIVKALLHFLQNTMLAKLVTICQKNCYVTSQLSLFRCDVQNQTCDCLKLLFLLEKLL